MRLARILIAIVATFTAVSACAQHQFGTKNESRDEAVVVCADGLTESSCRLAQSIVRLSLKPLSTSIPGWRVVVVPESRWNEAARDYQVEPSRPAFSALGIHTTYLES